MFSDVKRRNGEQIKTRRVSLLGKEIIKMTTAEKVRQII